MKKNVHNIEEEYNDDILASMLDKAKTNQEVVDYRMKLTAKIIKGIKAKGWNKSKFGGAMGIKNISIITKWLSGTNNFEADTLFNIEKVLGINLLNTNGDFNITGKSIVFTDVSEATKNDYGDYELIDAVGGLQTISMTNDY